MATQSHENATVFQQATIGVETTPGTAATANKRLLTTSFENLRPDIPTTRFRTYGSKAATSVVRGKGKGMAGIRAALNPWDCAYLLSTVTTPVITTPGGGTNSRNHQFKIRNFLPDTFDTLTVETGSFAGSSRATYGVLNGFEISVSNTDALAQLTGNWLCRQPVGDIYPVGSEVMTITKSGTVSGGTFTITPNGGSATGNINWNDTAAEIQAILEANAAVGVGNVIVSGGDLPNTTVTIQVTGDDYGTNVTDWTLDDTNITGGGDLILTKVQDGAAITDMDAVPLDTVNWDIYVSTTFAGLPSEWTTGNDADSLLRASSFGVTFPENRIPYFALRSDHTSFTSLVENNVEGASVRFSHMVNNQGEEFLTDLQEGNRLFLRAVATHPVAIEGSIYPGIMITTAMEVETYEPGDNGGAYEASINGAMVYDPDLGGFLDIQMRNDLTAIS
jgi:hypothetical protein